MSAKRMVLLWEMYRSYGIILNIIFKNMKQMENPRVFRATEEIQSDVCEGLMKAPECTYQASIFPLKYVLH